MTDAEDAPPDAGREAAPDDAAEYRRTLDRLADTVDELKADLAEIRRLLARFGPPR